MQHLSSSVEFFVHIARIEAIMARKFDSRLNGISLTEFIILYHLSHAEGEKMRRVDLAEKVGLTASGITRLLLPMEKIGLVKREVDENDARVSFVALGRGGRTKLVEGIERAELLAAEVIPSAKLKKVAEVSKLLSELV